MIMLGRLDRMVYATRLDRIIFMKFQPRAFRWTPLLVVAALVFGYALMAKTASALVRDFWIGLLLFWGAFLAAFFIRAFGPRFTATATHPLDERELMVKARAYAISGIAFSTLAMLSCFYMAGAGALALWYPHLPYDWINLGFGLQAGSALLPTFVASWLEPDVTKDQDD